MARKFNKNPTCASCGVIVRLQRGQKAKGGPWLCPGYKAPEVLTLRLYEHKETRARVDGDPRRVVSVCGWDFYTSMPVYVDGRAFELETCSGNIHCDDVRGNYVIATAREVRRG